VKGSRIGDERDMSDGGGTRDEAVTTDVGDPPTSAPSNDDSWQDYLRWVQRFFAWEGYDESERNYKLVIGERLVAARAALLEGDPEWLERLRTAFGAPNNLTNWRFNKPFLDWCAANTERAETALQVIWDEDRTVRSRFNDFVDAVSDGVERVTVAEASFLHMAMGPTDYPIFRATPVSKGYELTGSPDPHGWSNVDPGGRYEHFLGFLDCLLDHAAESGIELRDRLDAQSIVWSISSHQLPPDATDEEWKAFERYRNPSKDDKHANRSEAEGGGTPVPSSGVPKSSREAILGTMRAFDLQDRDTDDWRDWESDLRHKWAIVHEGQRYPVKEMIARAAGTSTHGFSGGDEANRYARSLGFTVERLRSDPPSTVWWVNQGATYQQERDHGIVWAPQKGRSDRTFAHWRNLTKIQPGDFILHYANTALRAVSIVTSPYVETAKPGDLPRDLWQDDGYLVETNYTELDPPIPLAQIPLHHRQGRPGGPFTQLGDVNQGYLYPAPDGLLADLVRRFKSGWPAQVIEWVGQPPERLIKVAPGPSGSEWDDCLAGGYICVGWDDVGDLRGHVTFDAFLERFREAYGEKYNQHAPKILEKAQELWTLRELTAGDRIVANRGVSAILGVGTVREPVYGWLPDRASMRHIVHVDWDDREVLTIPRQGHWAFKTILELPPSSSTSSICPPPSWTTSLGPSPRLPTMSARSDCGWTIAPCGDITSPY
jgi:hypothetical protein